MKPRKKGIVPAASKRKRARVEDTERALNAVQDLMLPDEAGYLEAEGMEKTHRFRQQELGQHVDEQSSKKMFDLSLDEFGPYRAKFGRNGRYMLLCGAKGHVASVEWAKGRLQTELHLRETCRDATYLHNDTMFAVAQKKYLYIYDNTGSELHCLRTHSEPNRLTFLPHHFLLASIGKAGWLKYQDTSTGELVSQHRTKLGNCEVMTQNSRNAVVILGHSNGTTTMWTPNMGDPVVRMFCHRSPLSAAAVDSSGQYLVTAGLDCKVKVWDLRKTYEELNTLSTFTPAVDIDVSQKGLLGVVQGVRVEMWKDVLMKKGKGKDEATVPATAPYMTHQLGGGCRGQTLEFCPYEDVAAVGHAKGVSTMLVPGAGEPNYDSYVANPFESHKQRREAEVYSLLDKIPADMITLDPNHVMKITKAGDEGGEGEGEEDQARKEKRRTRGRNRAIRRLRRKETFIIDRQRDMLREKRLKGLEAEREAEEGKGSDRKRKEDVGVEGVGEGGAKKSVLDRFA